MEFVRFSTVFEEFIEAENIEHEVSVIDTE